jgi:FkbM family methyltransferase
MLKHLAKRALERTGLHHDFLGDARMLLGDASGLVLFDVGGNVGQTAADMVRRFKGPRIYSFEPSPKSFAALRERCPSVTCEQLAFGDAPGKLPFHLDSAWSVNDSLLRPAHGSDATVEVQVDTIDAYCDRQKIERIDLLKIDTQGYDVRVLEGAAQMLAHRQIRLFSAEANLTPMYDGQPQPSALFAFAERFGYRVVGVYPGDYWGGRLAYLNAMFEAPQ